MFHELDKYGNPPILDVMVVAGELPDYLFAIHVSLRYEGIALVCEGLSDIFTLHEMTAIEVDL
jgi:hypothetical protein